MYSDEVVYEICEIVQQLITVVTSKEVVTTQGWSNHLGQRSVEGKFDLVACLLQENIQVGAQSQSQN